MGKEGKNLYLNLNTTGLLQAFFEAFEHENLGRPFSPQYNPDEVNYDIGMIKDWRTGEDLVIVGEPQKKSGGTREVKILVPDEEGERILDNFIQICNKKGVEVYPF